MEDGDGFADRPGGAVFAGGEPASAAATVCFFPEVDGVGLLFNGGTEGSSGFGLTGATVGAMATLGTGWADGSAAPATSVVGCRVNA